jgi:hypothetical protein
MSRAGTILGGVKIYSKRKKIILLERNGGFGTFHAVKKSRPPLIVLNFASIQKKV